MRQTECIPGPTLKYVLGKLQMVEKYLYGIMQKIKNNLFKLDSTDVSKLGQVSWTPW